MVSKGLRSAFISTVTEIGARDYASHTTETLFNYTACCTTYYFLGLGGGVGLGFGVDFGVGVGLDGGVGLGAGLGVVGFGLLILFYFSLN